MGTLRPREAPWFVQQSIERTKWKSYSGPVAYSVWHKHIFSPPPQHCFVPLVLFLVVKVTRLKLGNFYQGYFQVDQFRAFAGLTLLPLRLLEGLQFQEKCYRMTGCCNGGLLISVQAGIGNISSKSGCVNVGSLETSLTLSSQHLLITKNSGS